jgi:hypothetical protein
MRTALALYAASLVGCAPVDKPWSLSDIYPPVDGVPVLGRYFIVSGRKDAAIEAEFRMGYFSTSTERKCQIYRPFPVSMWEGRLLEETVQIAATGDAYHARLPLDLVRDGCVYRAAYVDVVTRHANRTHKNRLGFSRNNAGQPAPLSITFRCGSTSPTATGSRCALADDQGEVIHPLAPTSLVEALGRATISFRP